MEGKDQNQSTHGRRQINGISPLPGLKFKAPEYQKDGSFQETTYEFRGSETDGWAILREEEPFLQLGPGYRLLDSLYCGVCSTDLARKFLPYPLPQIIGHEVVARHNDSTVVVEINASHKARGLTDSCPFCSSGLETQCPDRITLGIDRLPGGFAPSFLAPIRGILEVPGEIPPVVAALTEPFAAALHAVRTSPPSEGDRVAVVGPRRLGALVIAALAGYRNETSLSFSITSVIRHSSLEELCMILGSDEVILTGDHLFPGEENAYDILFDTTGTEEGFVTALRMSRKNLHLKSTHGREVMGFRHLTGMVVDEIALLPFREESFRHTFPRQPAFASNPNVLVSPALPSSLVESLRANHPDHTFHVMDGEEAARRLLQEAERGDSSYPPGSPLPRFDLAVAGSPQEVDRYIRPLPGRDFSPVRPRGAILIPENGNDSPLLRKIAEESLSLATSRCGDFRDALTMLHRNPWMVQAFESHMISALLPLHRIDEAFALAADSSRSVKVIVQTRA